MLKFASRGEGTERACLIAMRIARPEEGENGVESCDSREGGRENRGRWIGVEEFG